ncbi:MAG TPA: hypothetical protein VM532_17535 [Burkholderiales bacterium]|jgi:hypothetical protein|nr:hypothetical protein [Burkholderiales bacterium]
MATAIGRLRYVKFEGGVPYCYRNPVHEKFRSMVDNPIPPDIQEFILKHIDSISHMEALLLLWRSPDVSWDIGSITQRLYVTEKNARAVLTRLHGLGLVAESNETYRYQPSLENAEAMIDRLAQLYATHLIPITNLIHSKPSRRIQEFADAFNLRKDS